MTNGNEQGAAEHDARNLPEVAPHTIPHGTWSVENLLVGRNFSITSNGIQVAVCGRRDVAEYICRAVNEKLRQVDLFLDEPPSAAQAKVLNHALHLLDQGMTR